MSLFSFLSSKTALEQVLEGMTDCHSHILPGVDDGFRTVDEALEALEYMASRGVRKLLLTPHIMEDYPANTASFLRGEFERFSSLYKGEIELSLGAEYMLDSKFMSHLDSGEMLTLWDNYVLVETSYMGAAYNIKNVISTIMSRGYFVILAHPERYLYMESSDYQELIDMGVLFQLNLPSISGGYGKAVQKRAQTLLNKSFYSYLGSDMHSLKAFSQRVSGASVASSTFNMLSALK